MFKRRGKQVRDITRGEQSTPNGRVVVGDGEMVQIRGHGVVAFEMANPEAASLAERAKIRIFIQGQNSIGSAPFVCQKAV